MVSIGRRSRRAAFPSDAPWSSWPTGHAASLMETDVSFFDEDDEPTRTASTRTRPRPPAARAGGRGSADSADAAGAPRRGCRRRARRRPAAAGRRRALAARTRSTRTRCKDYNRQVDGDRHRVRPDRQRVLQGCSARAPDQSPQDLQTAISGYRVQAEQQLKQAQGLSTPDEMKARPAVAADRARAAARRRSATIAQRIRTALGDQGEAADAAIKPDRRPDAGLQRLRRALPGARRARSSSDALDRQRASAASDRRARASCPRSPG